MAIKKSDIYGSLWKSCDELRGGMDASQYKDYVLVLHFVKYVSDKYAGQKDAMVEVPKGGNRARSSSNLSYLRRNNSNWFLRSLLSRHSARR